MFKYTFFQRQNVSSVGIKELSFCHKLKFYNPYIFGTWWCKPL